MAVSFEGQGTTFTRSGLTLKPKTITVPGWEKDEMDVSTLSNTAFRTYILKKLKKIDDLVLKLEFDLAVYKALPASNGEWTITFSDAAGTVVLWGDIKKVGGIELDVDSNDQLVFDLTVKITNRNGSGVETGPA